MTIIFIIQPLEIHTAHSCDSMGLNDLTSGNPKDLCVEPVETLELMRRSGGFGETLGRYVPYLGNVATIYPFGYGVYTTGTL